MKNFKKVMAVTLVSTMAMSMTACGDSESSADSSNSSASATEATFNIGGIGPTTGAASTYGISVKNGAEIAIEEINAAGGINGYEIALNFQDDEADAGISVNAYNQLKDWDMDLLLGTVTSGAGAAVAPEAAADGMFMLTPSGSSTALTEDRTNVFQVCFSDPNQGVGAAQYIGDNELATKVAVIYNSMDIYSEGIYNKFLAEAANHSFEIVETQTFTDEQNTSFEVQLQKVKDSGAELVFLPIYYQEASLILDQANTLGVDATFFGCDGLDGILTIEGFNTELAEGVILLTPFVADSEDEATSAFVAKYEELYGETPNQFAADAYDAIYIIKEAIEACDATPEMSVADLGAALSAAMTTISYDGLTGEAMTWSAAGEVAKAPKAMVIENGVYVSLN